MKILLINLPLFVYTAPPSGMFYLKGFLDQKLVDADTLDLNLEFQRMLGVDDVTYAYRTESVKESTKQKIETILKRINFSEYDTIGCTLHAEQSFEFLKITVDIIKKISPREHTFLVGGTGTNDLDGSLFPEVAVITGTGEKYFSNLLGLGDYELYSYPQAFDDDIRNNNTFNVVVGRGCINDCNYCAARKYFNMYFRKPKHVIEEIEYMRSTYGVTDYNFLCENLNNSVKKLTELCEPLAEYHKKHPISWCANFAISKNIPDYHLLKAAGCKVLNVGVEAGSDIVRLGMNKKLTNDQIINHLKLCVESGITNKLYVMTGYLTETKELFSETLDFLEFIFTEYKECIRQVKLTIYSHANNFCRVPSEIINFEYHDNEEWLVGENTLDERIRRFNLISELVIKHGIRIKSYVHK